MEEPKEEGIDEITTLRSKIEVEMKLKEGAEVMLKALTDEASIQSCKSSIRESSKRLGFLLNETLKLQKTRLAESGVAIDLDLLEWIQSLQLQMPSNPSNNPSPAPSRKTTAKHPAGRKPSVISGLLQAFTLSRRSHSESSISSITTNASNNNNNGVLPDLGNGVPAKNLFGYMRADTSITRDKVQFLINETQRKLEIEDRVKEGTQRMIEAMENDPDTKKNKLSLLDTKLNECKAKITILQKGLFYFQGIELPKSANPESPTFTSSSRDPFSGKFAMTVHNIAALSGKKSKAEVKVAFRVDNASPHETKLSNSDWSSVITHDLEKAHEIEIAIVDSMGALLGLVWFQLSDLAEELNRIDQENPPSPSDVGKARSLDAWLDLIPGGKLNVTLSIAPEKIKRKKNASLSRQKAVQKFTIKQGHKFSAINSYQVLKCAVCKDFLISGQGLNCQMCDFTCHKRCEDKVIPKCISLLSADVDQDILSITSHNIPHRFAKSSTMGVHWCGHCGKTVSIGKDTHSKCSECNLVAHDNCVPSIPRLCGAIEGHLEWLRNRNKDLNSSKELTGAGASLENMASSKADLTKIGGQGMPNSITSNPSIGGTFSQKSDFSVKSESSPLNRLVTDKRKARGESLAYFRHGSKGVGLDDFTFLAVLGKGNFGKVMLAQEKFTNAYYGIKVLKKEFILEHDEVESTKCEKRCFQVATRQSHPFLVNLHSCFQTESRLYFVMEYVSGGDLMWHIQHRKFTSQQARFYACEVLLALEYWHSNSILYRDLKLDNILLTVHGHVKIADYGLCKENMVHGSTTSTFCGTPEFMAPEILSEKPYGRAVDWWSFGVLIYEMTLGKAPFSGENEDRIFHAIVKSEPKYPPTLHPDTVDILQKLLIKDPSKRLGGGPNDAKDIKAHPYFFGVNWDDVYNVRIPAPYLPNVTGPTDLSNFDDEFTNEMPVLTPVHSVLSTANQEEFRGFTFMSEWAAKTREAANI